MTKPTTSVDTICAAAMREARNEASMLIGRTVAKRISKRIEGENSRNFFAPGKVYDYLVHIYDEPISLSDFRALKPNIRITHGTYTIQYIPAGSFKRNPKFPYLIGQDLVRIRVTVSGPRHWAMMCRRIPELDWIRRNSTLSDELFRIAKMHPGLVLRFGIDLAGYCAKIERKAEELGIDIDHKPLVAYQWGSDSVPRVDDDGIIGPTKTKRDYASALSELNEASQGEEEI